MPRYRATVGESQFDFELNGEEVFIDGSLFPCDIHDFGDGRIHLIVDGHCYAMHVASNDDGISQVLMNGSAREVLLQNERALLLQRYGISQGDDSKHSDLKAPMPGLVVRISVEKGDKVEKGDSLLVLEAMKMENELRAPSSGTVSAIHVSEHDAVTKNQLLVELDSAA